MPQQVGSLSKVHRQSHRARAISNARAILNVSSLECLNMAHRDILRGHANFVAIELGRYRSNTDVVTSHMTEFIAHALA